MNTTNVTFSNLQGRTWILSDDQNTTPQLIVQTGTYQFGNYDDGITVVQTITATDDSECTESRTIVINCPA